MNKYYCMFLLNLINTFFTKLKKKQIPADLSNGILGHMDIENSNSCVLF